MSERKSFYDEKLVKIGELLKSKRLNISKDSRESFISERSDTLFGSENWISLRHLANLEEGKNLPSIEMLIKLASAFETDPVDLFEQIFKILNE